MTDKTPINQDVHDNALETHPCPNEVLESQSVDDSIISKQLDDIQIICQSHDKEHKSIFILLEALLERDSDHSSYDEHLRIVAECQKQTAALASHDIERHALNPAIETVFILANALQDLTTQSRDLDKSQTCPLVHSLLISITEAVKLANCKCDYLDILRIAPKDLDGLDPQQHEITKAAETADGDKHKKIQATLMPGLLYRGKVLRRAKVCVYRYVNS